MITNRIRVFCNILGLGNNFSVKLVLNNLLVDLQQESCYEILFFLFLKILLTQRTRYNKKDLYSVNFAYRLPSLSFCLSHSYKN